MSKKLHSSFTSKSGCSSCVGKRCVHCNTLNVLFEARLNGINSTSEFAEVEVTVDSGACDTVMPEEDWQLINVVSSRESQVCFHHEVANGLEIHQPRPEAVHCHN